MNFCLAASRSSPFDLERDARRSGSSAKTSSSAAGAAAEIREATGSDGGQREATPGGHSREAPYSLLALEIREGVVAHEI